MSKAQEIEASRKKLAESTKSIHLLNQSNAELQEKVLQFEKERKEIKELLMNN